MKKRQKIEEIMKKIEDQFILDFSENEELLQKYRKIKAEYSTADTCSLIERFLIPQYNQNNLRNYIEGEVMTYNALAQMMGLPDVKVTKAQLDFVCDKITEIIEVILK